MGSYTEGLTEAQRETLAFHLIPDLAQARPGRDGFRTVRAPYRDDRTPSLSFHPGRGYGRDFGTDEGFDLVTLAQRCRGFDTEAEAISYLRLLENGPGTPAVPAVHSGDGTASSQPPTLRPSTTPGPSFWCDKRKQRFAKAQKRLKESPEHPLIHRALRHDGLRFATLVAAGVGLGHQPDVGDILLFSYAEGCQAYSRTGDGDGEKHIRHSYLGVKSAGRARPTASFFDAARIEGRPILLLAKSPREALLFRQELADSGRKGFDVVGLCSGEMGTLSSEQSKWLSGLVQDGLESVLVAFDRDTDAAADISDAFCRAVFDAAGTDVAALDVHASTNGRAKDYAEAVQERLAQHLDLGGRVLHRSGGESASKTERPSAFSITNPLLRSVPKRRWVVEGLAARGEITVIGGQPGAGKSLIVQHLLQKRNGQRLLHCPESGPALYFANLDASEDELIRRAHSIGGGNGLRLITLEAEDCAPIITHDLFFDRLLESVINEKADAVVFDTLADFHEGDLNDGAKANATMSRFRKLALLAGIAVILITHTRKSTATRQRLHVYDLADSRIYTSKADHCIGLVGEATPDGTTLVELQWLKTRAPSQSPLRLEIYDADGQLVFKKTDRPFLMEAVGQSEAQTRDKRDQEIVRLLEAGHTQRDVAEQLGISASTVNKAKKRCEEIESG